MGSTARQKRINALANLMPADNKEQAQIQRMYLEAVGNISDELIPDYLSHRYANHILAGPQAFADLLKRLDDAQEEMEIATIVDAIAEIIERFCATTEVIEALRTAAGSDSDLVHSVACRALALSGDEEFLEYQHHLLTSDSVSVVRTAAILLGFGRCEKALPMLIALLRPNNVAVLPPILWALGEIGSKKALPTLHSMLEERAFALDVVIALGKIGHEDSVPLLLGVLTFGMDGERLEAARALGLIGMRCGGQLADRELHETAKKLLLQLIDADMSKEIRYHALVTYSRFGGKLPQNRVMRALGGGLGQENMDPMSAFFAARSKGPKN